MKTQVVKLILVSSMFIFVAATAQPSSIKPLDIDLESYQYPYPVQFITLNTQDLKMAYMDVRPANANGHTVMLLHGKNFNGAYWSILKRLISLYNLY